MPSRLIVVSNRLPVTLEREGEAWQAKASSGGLATAMNPILRQHGGVWVGWSGESEAMSADERRRLLATCADGFGYRPVEIESAAASAFYEGFPNRTIWPLFHSFPSRMRFVAGFWESYVEGNRRFCDAVLQEAQPGDLIWVHDYHLMLLPGMLRERLPGARIGFFLHIPFPSSDIFSILPRRDEVLTGLLGADLVAFHTHRHVQHFRSSLLRVLGIESGINAIEHASRPVRLEAMPIGIAPEEFTALVRDDAETARHHHDLQQRYKGQRILVSVDRLDYTKGLPQRLRAMRLMLEREPSLAGNVVLIQVAVPSREGIDSYQDLRDEVNQLVSEINSKLGSMDWTPIVYIHRGIQRQELAALYMAADIGFITPLRDGMNLVAKEYCACKPEGNGVLVLSEFAGAAAELGEAFLVNPYDEERMAETLVRALRLDEDERRQRMQALHARVLRKNVFTWAEEFLAALEGTPDQGPLPTVTRILDASELRARYVAAGNRILVLDYDGTLVGYANRPEYATPPPAVIELLRKLCSDANNIVSLVSGRGSRDLDRWFGGIDRLIVSAEHGALLRTSAQEWTPLRLGVHSAEWKAQVRPILEHFVDRTPGSFIEEKELSLVWHFRMAEPEFSEWLSSELVALLEGLLADTEVRPVGGRKTVEVRPMWANKGNFVDWVLAQHPGSDFQLAAGDDRTDEDMFAHMPESAVTIHVGSGASRARFRIPSARTLVEVLRTAASDHED